MDIGCLEIPYSLSLQHAVNCVMKLHITFFYNLVGLDVIIFYAKLEELQICMKCQILQVFLPFIFLHGFDRKKCHKMLVFTFNPRVKNMCLVTSYVGHNNATNLVTNYDSQLLLLLLVEFYKSLMPTTVEEFS